MCIKNVHRVSLFLVTTHTHRGTKPSKGFLESILAAAELCGSIQKTLEKTQRLDGSTDIWNLQRILHQRWPNTVSPCFRENALNVDLEIRVLIWALPQAYSWYFLVIQLWENLHFSSVSQGWVTPVIPQSVVLRAATSASLTWKKKKGNLDIETDMYRGKKNTKAQGEEEGHLLALDHLRPPEARREIWNKSPSQVFEETTLLTLILDFTPPDFEIIQSPSHSTD